MTDPKDNQIPTEPIIEVNANDELEASESTNIVPTEELPIEEINTDKE